MEKQIGKSLRDSRFHKEPVGKSWRLKILIFRSPTDGKAERFEVDVN